MQGQTELYGSEMECTMWIIQKTRSNLGNICTPLQTWSESRVTTFKRTVHTVSQACQGATKKNLGSMETRRMET